MTAPVSVVIPTLESASGIVPCLGVLGEAVMAGVIHEVIVADGGSSDTIGEIAENVGARLLTSPKGRGPQLAAGSRAARGDWLLFLHADTVLSAQWSEAVMAHIRSRPGKAGFFTLRFDRPGTMAGMFAAWANLRAAIFALPYGDQGLLISRALYEQVGGYPEIPLMEDVALTRRIGRRRLARLGAVAVTSSSRYLADGWFQRGWRNMTTLMLYFLGVAPEQLARRYLRER